MKSGSMIILTLLFYRLFWLLWVFWESKNFKMEFSISEKKKKKHQKTTIEIFKGIALNLYISLSGIDILIILSLLIHERGVSFHLIIPSLIYFSNILLSPLYKSFTSFVEFSLLLSILFFLVWDKLDRVVSSLFWNHPSW